MECLSDEHAMLLAVAPCLTRRLAGSLHLAKMLPRLGVSHV